GDEVIERNLENEKLGHDIRQMVHGGINATEVHVGGDRIGIELLFNSGNGHIPEEAAGAVADVEENAPLARFDHRRTHLAVDDFPAQAGETMRVNISGT